MQYRTNCILKRADGMHVTLCYLVRTRSVPAHYSCFTGYAPVVSISDYYYSLVQPTKSFNILLSHYCWFAKETYVLLLF